jgi:predicted TIM-barrel fold metal-dependent hydrolase
VISDAHCHFFSAGFFASLGREVGADGAALPERLGWESPGTEEHLAARWIAELDRYGVARAMFIASVAGDEESVAQARAAYPERIVGAFMVNAGAPDAAARVERGFGDFGLQTACLFPAMHLVALDDERTQAIFAAAARHGRTVFVHCGVLSVGARKKLGLPSRFDLRLGDPLAVAALAVRHPDVPVVIPHFGAGMFREALMAASAAPNIHLDTSSSNSWIRFEPGLTMKDVFLRALDVVGPTRLVFGTDSSFFPRGWQHALYEEQRAILTDLDVSMTDQALIFSGNFERVFGDRGPGLTARPRP